MSSHRLADRRHVCCRPSRAAQTVWISDEFTVPLRSGPSNEHRIVHRGLPSGTELEVLGVDAAAEYTHVRTSSGLEGWISTQYLVKEPIARVQLVAANNRIQALEQTARATRRGPERTEEHQHRSGIERRSAGCAGRTARSRTRRREAGIGRCDRRTRAQSGADQPERATARGGRRPHRRVAAPRKQHRTDSGC